MCDLPRILHAFSTFDIGGPQVRTLSIMEATAHQFRHGILALDGRYGALKLLKSCRSADIVNPPPGIPRPLASIPRLRGVLRVAINSWHSANVLQRFKPALVVTYNLGAAGALAAARLSRTCRVIHCEDGVNGARQNRVLIQRYLRRMCTGNVPIVVPSHALQRDALPQLGVAPSRVHLITNGVDLQRFFPSSNSGLRDRLGFGQSDIVIGCVARLSPEKGHRLLLRAFAAAGIDKCGLLLIGDGPDASSLRKLTIELGIANSVVLAGQITDVAEYYRVMDVFALSSETEQMPLALLEAMATGLPVVCTDVGDCRQLLGSVQSGFVVQPGDVWALAAALRCMAGSPELRRRLGSGNRLRCEKEYELQGMIARYVRLYTSTLYDA
jgi:glycosyltransferase involved in cell wall biosynthesis